MDPTDNKVNFREKAPMESSRPIRLGGSVLDPPRHICAFFNNRDDEHRVLLPFRTASNAARRPSTPSFPIGSTIIFNGRRRLVSTSPRVASVASSNCVAGPDANLRTRHPYEVSTCLSPRWHISPVLCTCPSVVGHGRTYRQS
jgi:hypothetical protein